MQNTNFDKNSLPPQDPEKGPTPQGQTVEQANKDGSNMLGFQQFFSSAVYTILKPEFLNQVRTVSQEYLKDVKREQKLNPLYPVHQTANMNTDARISEFLDFVGGTSWNILVQQGYNMQPFQVAITEMWCQEHFKYSNMEQHIHGNGNQLVGFYFVDVPKDSSWVYIHDPRPAKVMINLPEADGSLATLASNSIVFEPREGLLFITNSYVPHSFSRHGGNKPLRFIHFNISVWPKTAQQLAEQGQSTPVEQPQGPIIV